MIEVRLGDFFDQCESGAEVSVVLLRNDIPRIDVRVNGQREILQPGARAALDGSCYLTFVRPGAGGAKDDANASAFLRTGCGS